MKANIFGRGLHIVQRLLQRRSALHFANILRCDESIKLKLRQRSVPQKKIRSKQRNTQMNYLEEHSMQAHLIFYGGAVIKSTITNRGLRRHVAQIRYVLLQLEKRRSHEVVHRDHVSFFRAKKRIICQVLENLAHKNQVSPTIRINGAMVKTESIRRGDKGNDNPKEQISG